MKRNESFNKNLSSIDSSIASLLGAVMLFMMIASTSSMGFGGACDLCGDNG
jgi:hypothetical protein